MRTPHARAPCALDHTPLNAQRSSARQADNQTSNHLQSFQSQPSFNNCTNCAGSVEGVLWYFPFEHERETLPTDPSLAAYRWALEPWSPKS